MGRSSMQAGLGRGLSDSNPKGLQPLLRRSRLTPLHPRGTTFVLDDLRWHSVAAVPAAVCGVRAAAVACMHGSWFENNSKCNLMLKSGQRISGTIIMIYRIRSK